MYDGLEAVEDAVKAAQGLVEWMRLFIPGDGGGAMISRDQGEYDVEGVIDL